MFIFDNMQFLLEYKIYNLFIITAFMEYYDFRKIDSSKMVSPFLLLMMLQVQCFFFNQNRQVQTI